MKKPRKHKIAIIAGIFIIAVAFIMAGFSIQGYENRIAEYDQKMQFLKANISAYNSVNYAIITTYNNMICNLNSGGEQERGKIDTIEYVNTRDPTAPNGRLLTWGLLCKSKTNTSDKLLIVFRYPPLYPETEQTQVEI